MIIQARILGITRDASLPLLPQITHQALTSADLCGSLGNGHVHESLEPNSLGSNPDTATFKQCKFGKVT